MAIDIESLKNNYFIFDKPVPYKLKCGVTISIEPVKIIDSMVFMSSYGILDIDKNQIGDADIIQMSYLKFLATQVFISEPIIQQFVNVCLLCLGCSFPFIRFDDKGKAILSNVGKDDNGNPYEIWSMTAKEFDNIRKIILYQNLPNYDDEYIDPELKKNMDEMDALRAKGVVPPSMERRMAIITSHTGISKKEQYEMTLRSHTALFEEVVTEVDYLATKGVAMYGGKAEEVQWVYKKAKGKYDDYITSPEKYNKSMGGDGHISKSVQSSEALSSQFDKFIGG